MADLVTTARGVVHATSAQVPDMSQLGAKLAGAAGGHVVASQRLAESIDAFITPGSVTEQVTGMFGRTKTRTVETPAPGALLNGDVRTAIEAGDARASQTIAAVALLETIGSETALLQTSGANLNRAVDDAVAAVRTLDLDPVKQQQLVHRISSMRPAVEPDVADPTWSRAAFAPRLSHPRANGTWHDEEPLPFTVGLVDSPTTHVARLQSAVEDNLSGQTSVVTLAPPRVSIRSERFTQHRKFETIAGSAIYYRDLTGERSFDTHGNFKTIVAAPNLLTPMRDQLRAGATTLQARLDGPDLRSIVREVNDAAQMGEFLTQAARSAAAERTDETTRAIAAATAGYETTYANLARS